MNLKTYRAHSMADALAQVKKDLGKDAVILHTRCYKVGAIMGVGGKNVVEITASDQATARVARARVEPARTPPAEHFVPHAFDAVQITPGEPRASPLPEPRPAPPQPASPAELPASVRTNPVAADAFLARLVSEPADLERAATPSSPRPPATGARSLAVRATIAPVDDSAVGMLQDELASIKRLVGQVLECSRKTAVRVSGTPTPGAGVMTLGGMADPLFNHYLRLQEVGIAPELAESIAGSVREDLTAGELSDEEIVRQGVLRKLASMLPVTGSPPRAGVQRDGRPCVVALIGPTGVGKTTTIAKLAATSKLRHGRRVGLVTCDTYRIAAVDQLRTYASIISLPLKVALTPAEVSQAIDALADCDLVLLDTAGRSQHDATRLAELREFLAAANPHEVHLVLSCTAGDAVLGKTAENFSALAPQRLIFSKLDEAVHFGPLVTIARKLALPVSYVTTGQEVPDQIELANSDRLARLVLDSALGT